MRLAELKIRLLGFFVARLRRWAGTIEQEIAPAKAPPNPVEKVATDEALPVGTADGPPEPPEHWARLFPTAPPQHWLDLFDEPAEIQPPEFQRLDDADISHPSRPEGARFESSQAEPEARRDPEQRWRRPSRRQTVFQNRYQEPASHSAASAGKMWLDRLRFAPPSPRSVLREGPEPAAGERDVSGFDGATPATMSGTNRHVRPTFHQQGTTSSTFPDHAVEESAKRGAERFDPTFTRASSLNAGDRVSRRDPPPDSTTAADRASDSGDREQPGGERHGKGTTIALQQSRSASALAERPENSNRDFAESDQDFAEKERRVESGRAGEVAFVKSDQFRNVVSAARDGFASPSFAQAERRNPQSYIAHERSAARETSAKSESTSISNSSEAAASTVRRENEFQAIARLEPDLEPALDSNMDRWPTLPPPQSSGIHDELLAREAEAEGLRRLEREQRGILWNE